MNKIKGAPQREERSPYEGGNGPQRPWRTLPWVGGTCEKSGGAGRGTRATQGKRKEKRGLRRREVCDSESERRKM